MDDKPLLHKAQNIALYILVFSLQFEYWNPFGVTIDFILTKTTISLYFLTILFEFYSHLKLRDYGTFFYPLIIYFIIQITVSYIHKTYHYDKFFDFPFFLNILILLVVINHSRRHPQLLYNCLLSFALGGILLTILFFLDIKVEAILNGRVTIFGDNPNSIGIKLAISVLILLTYFFDKNRSNRFARFILILLLPLMLKFLTDTGSRVAFISLFAGLLIFVVFRRSFSLFTRITTFIVGIILVIGIWYLLSQNVIISNRLTDSFTERDISGRDLTWEKLTPLILSNIFFGVGTTGYAKYVEGVFHYFTSPHNGIVEALCYTGIFGTFFFFVFVYLVIKRSIFVYKIESNLLPILLLMPFIGLLLSGQIFYPKEVWIIFAYIIAQNNQQILTYDNDVIDYSV